MHAREPDTRPAPPPLAHSGPSATPVPAMPICAYGLMRAGVSAYGRRHATHTLLASRCVPIAAGGASSTSSRGPTSSIYRRVPSTGRTPPRRTAPHPPASAKPGARAERPSALRSSLLRPRTLSGTTSVQKQNRDATQRKYETTAAHARYRRTVRRAGTATSDHGSRLQTRNVGVMGSRRRRRTERRQFDDVRFSS